MQLQSSSSAAMAARRECYPGTAFLQYNGCALTILYLKTLHTYRHSTMRGGPYTPDRMPESGSCQRPLAVRPGPGRGERERDGIGQHVLCDTFNGMR